MNFANAVCDLRRSDAVTNTPASHRISLRHRVDDHSSIPHATELGHRNVFDVGAFARIKNMLVNLVGEAERVKLLTEAGDKLHLIASENFSGRIVWIADDDRLGFLIK